MSLYQKFAVSFILALMLHFSILALFGISFITESTTETIKQKPLPEIIQASMLDDKKIIQEANRLKEREQNKKLAQQQKQKSLDEKLKKQQQYLENVKKQRQQEEIKTKEIENKRKELALKEQQKREQINKLKIEELDRLAKIKAQKEADELRMENLRKAEKKKREQIDKLKAEEAAQLEKIKQQKAAEKLRLENLRKAEETKKQQLLAKHKAEKAKKAALLKQQAAAKKAKTTQDKQAVISFSRAIQKKVINSWIKPIISSKGLRAVLRVKLLPGGDVMEVTVVKSSGNSLFDRSAENAVRKAEPLPVPTDRKLFSNKFRRFTFEFKPE